MEGLFLHNSYTVNIGQEQALGRGVRSKNHSRVVASTHPLYQICKGKVVSVNNQKFVKVTETQYMAVQPLCVGSGEMQTWNCCDSLVTPTYTAGDQATYFTQGPILTDARDGKSYEIRKFPDGKCWMVDNLRYGGTTDACNGKTAFSGNGSATATNQFGSGTYGDCRDPHQGGSAPCASGSTQCGYYYNWQAAMQLSSAYYNTNVTYPSSTPSTTANYIQGICPTGWHLPSGGTTEVASEFVNLDKAVGGSGANSQTTTNYTAFWRPTSTTAITSTDPWKGIYSGYSYDSGGLNAQASAGYWWSSAGYNAPFAYLLRVYTDVYPQHSSSKGYGFSVRCVKD
jgi:uncharacterized protein (TIGR02145 family)